MAAVCLAAMGEIFVTVQGLRPTPRLSVIGALPARLNIAGSSPSLQWPTRGEAVVEVPGIGSLGPVGNPNPVPIASLTKMMTATVVLADHPLSNGEEGPLIRVDRHESLAYLSDVAAQNSVVKVVAGEELTERQCLNALMLASADNIAIMLADWDAGSESSFVSKMNLTARKLGLAHTLFADAAGLSPFTRSTAVDQLHMGEVVLSNPVLTAIVGQRRATIPVAGTIQNTNYVVGSYGIIGIKTGDTSAAGGCYVFAANVPVAGLTVRVVGAVLGQGGNGSPTVTLPAAISAALRLLHSLKNALGTVTAVPAGLPAAEMLVPWGKPIPVTVPKPVQVVGWGGLPVRLSFQAVRLGPTVANGQLVGYVTIQVRDQSQRLQVRSSQAVTPPLSWRVKQL